MGLVDPGTDACAHVWRVQVAARSQCLEFAEHCEECGARHMPDTSRVFSVFGQLADAEVSEAPSKTRTLRKPRATTPAPWVSRVNVAGCAACGHEMTAALLVGESRWPVCSEACAQRVVTEITQIESSMRGFADKPPAEQPLLLGDE